MSLIKKSIFNSLGSNYSWGFALEAFGLLFKPKLELDADLEKNVIDKFGGQAFFVYKGRDAIWLALKALGVGKGDEVLTQAFSCHAVEEAVTRTGAKPVFVDLAPGKLNPGINELKTAFDKSSNVKLVIIQHTLGCPADIKEIASWCRENNLLLLEDLAQAVGGVDEEGQTLGSLADAVVLSFGRDKIVDCVAGGAVVLKTDEAVREAQTIYNQLPDLPKKVERVDLWYPVLTKIIRATHSIILGKVLLKLLRQRGWLKSPVWSPLPKAVQLSPNLSYLANRQLETLTEQIAHRRKIARIYTEHLSEISLQSAAEIEQGSNLRFSIKVPDPTSLISCLKQHQIYVADRWYRAPVDSGNLNLPSSYKEGSCSRAEKLTRLVLNLPTHQGVEVEDATRIVGLVNKWRQQHDG